MLPHIVTPVWGVKQTEREIEKREGAYAKVRGQHRLRERGKTQKIISRTMGERHLMKLVNKSKNARQTCLNERIILVELQTNVK